jgi:hypothetical protein
LDAYRRRYVAQATGFGNESADDRSEDEPHRRRHSIAEEQAEGEGEMTVSLLPSIFTIEIGGTPTLTFEARNLREAHELCREEWLKQDLSQARSQGAALWDGIAKIRTRIARPEECALFAEAKNSGQPSDGLTLVYLVELD